MRDIYLKHPLNRGKIEAPAGETVSVQDGLAERLIDRGLACDPKDAPKADPEPTKKAADTATKHKVAPPAPEKKGDSKPPVDKKEPKVTDAGNAPAPTKGDA